MVPVDSYHEGTFYSEHCYLVLYKYETAGRKEQAIVYFWEGSDSTEEDKTAAALLAAKIDQKEANGKAIQVNW